MRGRKQWCKTRLMKELRQRWMETKRLVYHSIEVNKAIGKLIVRRVRAKSQQLCA